MYLQNRINLQASVFLIMQLSVVNFIYKIISGARYIREKYGVKKIAIFDWDVHHGNGTQDTFINDKDTLFVSLHVFNEGSFYPSSGTPEIVGVDCTTINIGWNNNNNENPISLGDYVYAFERVLAPIMK